MEDLNHLLCNVSRPKPGSLKGDPRMNRAFELHLSKPQLPLLDTLCEAGFVFLVPSQSSGKADCPNEDNILDADGVSLSMRKNQLSNRVWLAKQQVSNCSNEVAPEERTERIQQNHFVSPSMKLHGIIPSYSSPTMTGQTVLRNDMIETKISNISERVPNRVTCHRGDDAKNMAFPKMTSSLFNYIDSMPSLKDDQLVTNTDKGRVSNEQKSNHRAQGKRMRTMHGYSQTRTTKEEKEHDDELKMQNALSFYETEVVSLVQECMIEAGFAPEDVSSNSLQYTKFLEHISESAFLTIDTMHTLCKDVELNEAGCLPQSASR